MSTVCESRECPRCKGYMSTEFNIRTMEEWFFCERCGLQEEWTLRTDDNGKYVKDDSHPYGYMDHKISGVYGVAHEIYGIDGCGRLMPLGSSYKECREIIKIWKKHFDILDLKSCYITHFNRKTGKIESIFGKKPRSYKEIMSDLDTFALDKQMSLGMTVSEMSEIEDTEDGLPF